MDHHILLVGRLDKLATCAALNCSVSVMLFVLQISPVFCETIQLLVTDTAHTSHVQYIEITPYDVHTLDALCLTLV